LSTIRYANKIIVLNKGRVVEYGTHDSLMQVQGVYYGLVEQQDSYRLEDKKFENYQPTEIFRSNQRNSDVRKERRSSIINFPSSILEALSSKRNSFNIENSEEVKVIKKIQLKYRKIKIIILIGKKIKYFMVNIKNK
jgi:ABC-type glutathione transport system ATPase component